MYGNNMTIPNWYGINGIGFEWRGSQNDPVLHYKGYTFNGNDIQDALWDMFLEDHGNPDNNDEWETFVTNNAIDYLDTLIELDFTQ